MLLKRSYRIFQNKNPKSFITNLSHLRESFKNDSENDTSNDVIDKSYRIFQNKIPKSFITNLVSNKYMDVMSVSN